jgi:hypothetical protein
MVLAAEPTTRTTTTDAAAKPIGLACAIQPPSASGPSDLLSNAGARSSSAARSSWWQVEVSGLSAEGVVGRGQEVVGEPSGDMACSVKAG